MKKSIICLLIPLIFIFSSCGSEQISENSSIESEIVASEETTVQVEKTEPEVVKETETVSNVNVFDCLKITDYSYCYNGAFAIEIENTSNRLIKTVDVRITGMNADGGIVGTTDISMHDIYPGIPYYDAFNNSLFAEEPETIEVKLLDNDYFRTANVPDWVDEIETPTIENVTLLDDRITGLIINNSNFNLDSKKVFVIVRDDSGHIEAQWLALVTYTGDIPAKESAPFEIATLGIDLSNKNYELYIQL